MTPTFYIAGLLLSGIVQALVLALVIRRKGAGPAMPVVEPMTVVHAVVEAPAGTPEARSSPGAGHSFGERLRDIVRQAIAERLAHERERPDRYPLDQREKSVLQRARRALHFAERTHEDDELRELVIEEVGRLS